MTRSDIQQSDIVNPNIADISIATINLFNYLEPPNAYYDFQNIYSQEQWQKKQDWLSFYLSRYQPDVVGFQEVFSPEPLQALCESSGYPYFMVLDGPDVEDDFIYSKPVVALASRYPILESESLTASAHMVEALGLKPGFNFSRQPLRVTLDLPLIGGCDCYVVHFKSKRPYVEGELIAGGDASEMCELMAQEALGKWGASIRRGSEAALLHHQMVKRRQSTDLPMVLMGDFNDVLSSDVLTALTYSSRQLPQEAQNLLAHYALKDSFELFQASDHCPIDYVRLPTHYYGPQGSVLDYIMLSNEFDPRNPQSLYEISGYHVHDDHLVRPDYELDSHSTDHAPVMITIKARD